MGDYVPDLRPVGEADDTPPERLRIFMYSDGHAAINGEVLLSGFGPNPVQTVARKLLALGHSPGQEIELHRGGEHVERVLLRDVAGEL
jgi:hypothetical protein